MENQSTTQQEIYIVYLNKQYDVWARDAYEWAKNNNLPTDHIISEVLLWKLMDTGKFDNKPVYFCREIQDDRQPFAELFTH